MMNDFLFKKQVDWSLLNEGFTLPLALHPFLRSRKDFHLQIGEKRPITIVLDGKSFNVHLINLGFSRGKYPEHKEIIQIRYSQKSDIASYFRLIFSISFDDISLQKAGMPKRIAVSAQIPEYFCLYATDTPEIFNGEAITAIDLQKETPLLKRYTEQEWENSVNMIDRTATIIEKEKIVKLRRLDRSIADSLKLLYRYRCQICGCSFQIPYGSNLIHAHHIAPFTQSLNNNPENIMILCPNHHGIVHDIHPDFDILKKVFYFPNGLIEPLKLNYHL